MVHQVDGQPTCPFAGRLSSGRATSTGQSSRRSSASSPAITGQTPTTLSRRSSADTLSGYRTLRKGLQHLRHVRGDRLDVCVPVRSVAAAQGNFTRSLRVRVRLLWAVVIDCIEKVRLGRRRDATIRARRGMENGLVVGVVKVRVWGDLLEPFSRAIRRPLSSYGGAARRCQSFSKVCLSCPCCCISRRRPTWPTCSASCAR